MVNHTYDGFVGITGALLLTRGIWKYFDNYTYGYFLFIAIGIFMLLYKNKIIKALPEYGAFTDDTQSRIVGVLAGLFIGYGLWNYTEVYVIAYTGYVIIIGMALLFFQKPIADALRRLRNNGE